MPEHHPIPYAVTNAITELHGDALTDGHLNHDSHGNANGVRDGAADIHAHTHGNTHSHAFVHADQDAIAYPYSNVNASAASASGPNPGLFAWARGDYCGDGCQQRR